MDGMWKGLVVAVGWTLSTRAVRRYAPWVFILRTGFCGRSSFNLSGWFCKSCACIGEGMHGPCLTFRLCRLVVYGPIWFHPALFLRLNAIQIEEWKAIAVFALQYEQILSRGKQVEVTDVAEAVLFADFSERLKRSINILRYLRSEIDVRLSNNRSHCVSKLYLLYRTVKILVDAVSKLDLWIVQHLEFLVIRRLTLVFLIKLVHAITDTSQSLKNVAAHFFVNKFKAAEEVQLAVSFLLNSQFFCT